MDLIQALILSFVEGVTEFLPISSTGHLILVSYILNITNTEFVKSFLIIIQLGAILSVVVLYFKMLTNIKIWPKILVGFIPSAAVGLIFYEFIKNTLIGNSFVTVIALFIGGAIFILVEMWNKKREKTLTLDQLDYKNALLIGVFQSISVIPGTSRAGATILGALILGFNRKTAAEFSFLLAIPTMLGATGLDIAKTRLEFSQNELILLIIGFVASFIFALLSVKLLLSYIKDHTFIIFGVYRIIVAILFYLIFLI
ncbi:MAG: undecaprenyl-diphosphatase UppP [Candidatus Levybacteria bacterium RIFCSPLOWO2_01_FULL_39_10]|nr:MAG: undecaprenyl-diphosphatase UppP [Candidatus Levybacteria bacterium RIFCSPLOWO2_01_FULL_39_10]